MAEIRTVTTLTTKAEALERAIAEYERALVQARADLAHVRATIVMFERDDPDATPRYADIHRLFARGEIGKICKAAIAKEGPLDTRELAQRVLTAKGFNSADAVLAKAVAFRIVQAMRMQHRRGTIGDAGRRKGVRIWKLTG